MDLRIFQVDAFADRLFAGNPAAIVPLDSWLDAGLMQAIAAENNLAETAFFVPEGLKKKVAAGHLGRKSGKFSAVSAFHFCMCTS